MKRKPKGSVSVELNGETLRIRLPRHIFKGKQIYLYLGLRDTPENRILAEGKAAEIYADIIYQRFDPTLERYKAPSYTPPPSPQKQNLSKLWEEYSRFKFRTIARSSRKGFKRVARHIEQLPSRRLSQSQTIINYITDNLTPDAAKRTLTQLSACCEWAMSRGEIDNNPFAGAAKRIRLKKVSNINPFSAQERDEIIEAFATNLSHAHYTDFVKFLFFTGCRFSEAVGLRWKHISKDLTYLTFAEAVIEGQRSSTTKTHTLRRFPINSELKTILLAVKPQSPSPNTPVFLSQKKAIIHHGNFLNRHWTPVVKSLTFPYRGAYHTRHTFITLCLDKNIPIAQVASWVGNSPEVILRHYAGLTKSEVPLL